METLYSYSIGNNYPSYNKPSINHYVISFLKFNRSDFL